MERIRFVGRQYKIKKKSELIEVLERVREWDSGGTRNNDTKTSGENLEHVREKSVKEEIRIYDYYSGKFAITWEF